MFEYVYVPWGSGSGVGGRGSGVGGRGSGVGGRGSGVGGRGLGGAEKVVWRHKPTIRWAEWELQHDTTSFRMCCGNVHNVGTTFTQSLDPVIGRRGLSNHFGTTFTTSGGVGHPRTLRRHITVRQARRD